jgi:tRNA uridine 5-carboxymethylaminomethyl modification enzyme
MYTSRAEYRLLLREDNADLRLTEIGRELGLVDDVRWRHYSDKQTTLTAEHTRLSKTWLRPAADAAKGQRAVLGQELTREYTLLDLLRRPEVRYADLMGLPGAGPGTTDPRVAEQLEIQAKYAGYIDRQSDEVERQRHHEETRLPADMDYAAVHGLSNEVRQKLLLHRPVTLGQAARLSGVTPAAIALLLVHLKRRA